MDKSLRNILINSTLAFISAFVITTIFHELGHYLSYALFGVSPTLFHNYVQTSDLSLSSDVKMISASAGPLFSLIQGVVFGYLVTKKQRNTPGYLFFLWLGLLGFVNSFGYLAVTPFTTTGDTGKVAEMLNLDFNIRLLIAVIGLTMLIWFISKVANNFAKFIPVQKSPGLKTKYVYRLMFFPIIIGSLVNILLAFPAVTVLSLIYPATSSYIIMSSFPLILKSTSPKTTVSKLEAKIQHSLIILFVSAILLNRLLTLGIG